jgi:hypothetical protein
MVSLTHRYRKKDGGYDGLWNGDRWEDYGTWEDALGMGIVNTNG